MQLIPERPTHSVAPGTVVPDAVVPDAVVLGRRLGQALTALAILTAAVIGVAVNGTGSLRLASAAAALAAAAIVFRPDVVPARDVLLAVCLGGLAAAAPVAQAALPAVVAAVALSALYEDRPERSAATALLYAGAYVVAVLADVPGDTAAQALSSLLPVALLPALAYVVSSVRTLVPSATKPMRLEQDSSDAVAAADASCHDPFQTPDAHLAAVVHNAYDVIAIIGVDGVVCYISPALESLLGRPPETVIGKRLEPLVRAEDADRIGAFLSLAADEGGASTGRLRVLHADGSWRHVEARGQRLQRPCGPDCPVHSDRVEIVLNIHDVSDRVSLEDELAHRAFHDALTNLPNRALLTNRVEQSLRSARRTNAMIGVLFCDLDDFKPVNDTLGHQVGDRLLVEVAHRLQECIRPTDTGARMGGDEFAVLLEQIDNAAEAEHVARRVLSRLEEPFVFGAHEITIRTSVGIAVGTAEDTAGELLRKADIAMYMAKRRGKNRFEVFRETDEDGGAENAQRLAELQRALEQGEFVAVYQPTIDLDAGVILGVEALVRWQHPERGLLDPSEFIPLAEESGLIVAIGSWMLREACEQVGRWEAELGDLAPREISVNLSAAQLARDDFVLEVADALDDTSLRSGALTLEITESGLMTDLALTSRRLGALKRLGVNLAVDDFGTGYSSLAYLQQFPIDTLKIDRAFVAHVDGSAENAALAKAIVRLGHDLNLRTIAEGIERPTQVEALRRMRCPVGQGFYFSEPLRADEIVMLLRAGEVDLDG